MPVFAVKSWTIFSQYFGIKRAAGDQQRLDSQPPSAALASRGAVPLAAARAAADPVKNERLDGCINLIASSHRYLFQTDAGPSRSCRATRPNFPTSSTFRRPTLTTSLAEATAPLSTAVTKRDPIGRSFKSVLISV